MSRDMDDRKLLVRMSVVSTILFGFYLLLAWIGLEAGLGLPVIVAGLLVFVGIQYLIGKWSVLFTLDTEPFPAEKFPDFYARYERTSDRMGFSESPKLLVADMDAPNAFAVGRKGGGVVVISPALFELLDADESMGVLAHELAHLKNRDSVMMVVGQSISSIIGLGVFLLMVLSDSFLFNILALLLGAVAKFLVLLFVLALSRYREYAADRDAARAIGSSRPLASALQKIDRELETNPPSKASTAQLSALCISPLERGGLASLLSTHPSTEKRIEQLKSISE